METPATGMWGSDELVARVICKSKNRNPDMCVFGSSSLSSDGTFTSECSRYAWQDELHTARMVIAALSEAMDARGLVLIDRIDLERITTADADAETGGE